MPYKQSGTLRTGRHSPTENTVNIDDWNSTDLTDLEVSGAVRLAFTDIVGYWPLGSDAIDSGTVEDRSGTGNDGSISGDPTNVDGRVGEGIALDGSGDWVEVPHDSSLNVQSGDFSLVGWIQVDQNYTSDPAPVVSKKGDGGVGDTELEYQLCIGGHGYAGEGDNPVIFAYGDGSSVYGAAADAQLAQSSLYHLVASFDSSDNTVSFHIDGVPAGQTSLSAAPIEGTQNLFLGVHFDGSGTPSAPLNGTLDDVRIRNVTTSEQEAKDLFKQGSNTETTFRGEYIEELFGSGYTDPLPVYDPDRSPPYLLAVNDNNNSTTPLYESSDLSSWTEVSSDITPNFTDDGGSNLQDYVYIDGTYYVYACDSDTDTVLFSGPSLTDLTNEGVVLSGEADVGVYYEDGMYYVYSEGEQYENEPTSESLELRTSSNPDGPWTDEGEVIDVRDRVWHTGDPDIERFNGSYYMFMDRSISHPRYHTALARSDDLVNWTIIDDHITHYPGGDLQVLDDGSGFPLPAFSEFNGADQTGIGRWKLHEI